MDSLDSLISEVLGRDAEPPLLNLGVFAGGAVMVTGAGGSIGSEVSLQLTALGVATIILFERSEYALYTVEQQVRLSGFKGKIVPVLGDVIDGDLVCRIMTLFKVDTVIHAAAYKHVPLVEQNPLGGVKNNFLGTDKLAQCAIKCGVYQFLCISTDKAVNPTNVMGASKRLAEWACLSKQGKGTKFTVVRFGNVMGSTGSVLPLFYRQLKTTKEVTVTHPEVTRYFMSVHEAVQLVLQALILGEGVYVLDMGKPVLIVQVAVSLAEAMNVEDYTVSYIGLRPGEKLYEELTLGDELQPTRHPRISEAGERDVRPVAGYVTTVQELLDARDVGGLRMFLQQTVPGYMPMCGIMDTLWLEENVWQVGAGMDDCFKTPSPTEKYVP